MSQFEFLRRAGFCSSQTVTLSAKSGPPTTKTLLSGSGFSPFAEIDIYFDSVYLTFVNANCSGSFSKVALQVPAWALPGTNWVSAEQISNQTGAQAPFHVITNWLEEGFTPTGTRFNPYENVLDTSTVSGLAVNWAAIGLNGTASTLANNVLYVGSSGGNLYALNATTGHVKWSYTTGAGVSSTPAVANGLVYFGSGDNNVYALNATTGAKVWNYTTSGAVNSSPAVVGGVVYVGSNDNNVYALNAKTGALLWSYNTGGTVSTDPAVSEVYGLVYVGISSNLTGIFDALSTSNGTLAWSVNFGAFAIPSSAAVVNGKVYTGNFNNGIYALNAITGTQEWVNAATDAIESSPAVSNGVVFVNSNDGNLYEFDATNGGFIREVAVTANLNSSPAVANGVVYVTAPNNNVYAFDVNSLTNLWQYGTGSSVTASPIVANGVLYVCSQDDNVYAFGLPTPPSAPQRPDLRTLHRISASRQ